jgi:glucosyl-dolichyl phosphate glucuronosyltransferase
VSNTTVGKKVMSEQIAVSVVISTYNRAAVLPQALDSIVNQDAGNFRYEVIVVDNNSHDNTRAVVESYLGRGNPEFRYVFEGRQGVSYGRNAGIAVARGAIIAFFDDDISVSRDWLATIRALMDEHPEVDFIGGKVLPEWTVPPPAWLTPANWSPVALVDYGPEPLYATAENELCLVTANLAVRRSLFETVGLFSLDLQRVKDSIGSMEDHELLIRAWRAGKRGLYAPNLIVTTGVPQARMTKRYHRRWHRGHGVFCSMIRSEEDIHRGNNVRDIMTKEPVALFGVPAFVYRKLGREIREWILSWLRRREDASFRHETQVHFLASYIAYRRRQEIGRQHRSALAELGSFVGNLARKKVHKAVAAGYKRSDY